MNEPSGEGAYSILPRSHPLVAQHPLERESKSDVRLEDLPDDVLGQHGQGVADAGPEYPVARYLVLEEFP